MSKFVEVHPINPQPRTISRAVSILRDGGVIAYPTDSGFALGCAMGNLEGQERIAKIRGVGIKHNFTLICANFAQAGPLVLLDNAGFRLVKRLTPGPYTFIIEGTKEVPKSSLNSKKKTIGIRISPYPVVQSLVTELGSPLVSSSLIAPEGNEVYTDGWSVFEDFEHQLDLVIDAPIESAQPTSVIDLTAAPPEVIRVGSGDVSFLD
ncbi:threonylcarbamoyl-AMP synthase [Actinomycetaceae bacterium TAE3-ERU4]|nr:threonylcarbamoyl-AMP synthase [Actinomycetaceae bacterium TAE3-ERU4]